MEAGDVTSIEVERLGRTAVIQLRGPRVRNALAMESLLAFSAAIDDLHAQDVAAVVVAGDDRAFCAGGDLREETVAARSANPGQAFAELTDAWNDMVLRKLELSPMATVAALDGPAVGGGFELALACDIRVASRGMRMGDREVRLGMVGSARLVRATSVPVALGISLTSRWVYADEALRIGLVHEITDGPAVERARRIAEEIAAFPREAVAAAKRLIRDSGDQTFHETLTAEREAIRALADLDNLDGRLNQSQG